MVDERSKSEIQAVILCGGAGVRLRGVLNGLPKALATVGDRPFLDYVLRKLKASGIHDVVLCIGVHGQAIRDHYGKFPVEMTLRYSEEWEPLGTGGALRNAEAEIRCETFLLLNGDTFLGFDVAAFLAQHRRTAAAITLALARVTHGERYGTVELDAHGQVRRFREKQAGSGERKTGREILINAGWYLMQRGVLPSVAQAPPAVSLELDVLPQWIGRGLYGHVTDGYFIDIGVPEDLRRAQTELAQLESARTEQPRPERAGRAHCDAAHSR